MGIRPHYKLVHEFVFMKGYEAFITWNFIFFVFRILKWNLVYTKVFVRLKQKVCLLETGLPFYHIKILSSLDGSDLVCSFHTLYDLDICDLCILWNLNHIWLCNWHLGPSWTWGVSSFCFAKSREREQEAIWEISTKMLFVSFLIHILFSEYF